MVDEGGAGRKLSFTMATVNDSRPNIPSTTTDPGMPPLAAIDGDPKTAWGIRFGEARDPFLAVRFSEPVKTSATSRDHRHAAARI